MQFHKRTCTAPRKLNREACSPATGHTRSRKKRLESTFFMHRQSQEQLAPVPMKFKEQRKRSWWHDGLVTHEGQANTKPREHNLKWGHWSLVLGQFGWNHHHTVITMSPRSHSPNTDQLHTKWMNKIITATSPEHSVLLIPFSRGKVQLARDRGLSRPQIVNKKYYVGGKHIVKIKPFTNIK